MPMRALSAARRLWPALEQLPCFLEHHPRMLAHHRGSVQVETSPGERHFCGKCGSALWLWDHRWPELIHPNASAIETPLPQPPEIVQIFLESKPSWVQLPEYSGVQVVNFDAYPTESLEDWHKRHGLFDPPTPSVPDLT